MFVRYQDPAPLPPLLLGFWRTLDTIAILLPLFLIFKPSVLRIRWDVLPLVALVGVAGMGGFLATYNTALRYSSVATAVVLLYTAPAWAGLLSWRFLGEPMTGAKLGAISLAFGGCIFVAQAYDLAALNLNLLGVAGGLGAGFFFGVRTVLSKFAVRRCPPLTITFYTMVFAAATLLVPEAGSLGRIFDYPWTLWIYITIVAIAGQIMALFLYTSALQYISAGLAVTIGTLEPVFAALLAFLLLGETISPAQALGGLLVLSGVLLFTRASLRADARAARRALRPVPAAGMD